MSDTTWHSIEQPVLLRKLWAFGKMHFGCLHKSGGLRYSPESSCAIIVLYATLHNVAVQDGIYFPNEETMEDEVKAEEK